MTDTQQVINLTAVRVVLIGEDGARTEYLPSGIEARVDVEEQEVLPRVQGHRRTRVVYGAVQGLPEPRDGVLYIVSMPVGMNHGTGRTDLIGPNTNKAIRGDGGQIIGVPSFVQY
jgi:hypothetical protein